MDGYDDTIDYCGPSGARWIGRLVPRRIWGVDINPCCYWHDVDYGAAGVTRRVADSRFYAAMRSVICQRYRRGDPRRYMALARARGYWAAVRVAGGLSWGGK